MNLEKRYIIQRKAIFENKLVQIILRIFLSHLFNVSISGCFNAGSEALTWSNQMILDVVLAMADLRCYGSVH